MADLVCTFTRAHPKHPVQVAGTSRTERLTISEGSDGAELGTLTAAAIAGDEGEHILSLYAGADCWVDVGLAPEAESPSPGGSSRFMAEGERLELWVEYGHKVSVVGA